MRSLLFTLLGILTLARKELRMILKDKIGRAILIGPIIGQTLIFGYVATFDLNRVDYALLDEDRTPASRELAARFDGNGIFRRVATRINAVDLAELPDTRRADVVVRIGPHFQRNLEAGKTVPVQLILDGRNSNVAGIASSYAATIIEDFNVQWLGERGKILPGVRIESRAWFNPNLETRWNIMSGLVAVLAVVQVLVLSAQAVAREREQGTLDQLLVTPYTTVSILWGKALPPILVGLVQSGLVLLVALYWFSIPFAGSVLTLYAGLLLFNAALAGLGLCISARTDTMQQAMLYAFTLLMPMILLSGFVTPIASMPKALQLCTELNPVRHGVAIAQKVYLEGADFATLTQHCGMLAFIAITSLSAAYVLLSRQEG